MNINTRTSTHWIMMATAATLLDHTAVAQEFCSGGASLAIKSVGANAEEISNAFEEFRQLLGGAAPNGNGAAATPSGHRQINWDAGAVPFDMPGNFFAETVDRGCTIASSANEFRVSNPLDGEAGAPDDNFDSIDSDAAANFNTFSAERLFSPVETNNIAVKFEIPGSDDVGYVTGFGAVFVDVNEEEVTKMTAYAADGCIIGESFVPPSAGGLSFLGIFSRVEFGSPPIASIEITLGDQDLDESNAGCNIFCTLLSIFGIDTSISGDQVVLDDFLYGEPVSLADINAIANV